MMFSNYKEAVLFRADSNYTVKATVVEHISNNMSFSISMVSIHLK